MFRRCLIACIAATALFAAAETANAAGPRTAPTFKIYTASQREAIRQMPLLERPNRPGHFYGNTVRRIYYGRRMRGR